MKLKLLLYLKSREKNVIMARALVVEQMVHAGFTKCSSI